MTNQEKIDRLNEIAAQIKTAKDLWKLHAALVEFQTVADEPPQDDDEELGYDDRHADIDQELALRGLDVCDLPLFSDREPSSTLEVWSYDDEHALVGTGSFDEWEIIERDGAYR